MENKKTARVIIIGILFYILLSWFIVAGNFNESIYENTGYNQIGILDFILAPINLFNSFVETKTQNPNGIVNSLSYINILLAFISIGIYYGVLNKTGAYITLVDKLSDKFKNHKNIVLVSIGVIYYLISVLTGLNLVLFLLFPFIVSILMKLKFNKPTIFTATIGSMLIGRVSCLFDSNINGLVRMLYQTKTLELVPSRIIFAILLLIVVVATLVLKEDKEVTKQEDIPLLDKVAKKDIKTNYVPIVLISSLIIIILSICMYNWYYMFNINSLSEGFNKISNTSIHKYAFMRNILGMTEEFGFWSGFTMSGLLLLGTLVIKFIYNIKFDKYIEGVKNGIIKLLPMLALSIICLIPIVLSIYYGDSFIYSIINRVLNIFKENVIAGTFISTFIHSFIVNDYFATMTTIQSPIISLYGTDSINMIEFISQITYGLSSLVSPFSIYLIAGLAYLDIPYTKWLKYIYKCLLVILVLSIIILIISLRFF